MNRLLVLMVTILVLLSQSAFAKESPDGYGLYLINYGSYLCGLDTVICDTVELGKDFDSAIEEMKRVCNRDFQVKVKCACHNTTFPEVVVKTIEAQVSSGMMGLSQTGSGVEFILNDKGEPVPSGKGDIIDCDSLAKRQQ